MNKLFLCFAIVITVCACTPAEGPGRALEVVKKSYEAHGGVWGTDSLKISFRFEIPRRIHEGQSLVALPPYELYSYSEEVAIDRRARKEVLKIQGNFAGVSEDIRRFIENGQGTDVNLKFKRFNPLSSLPNPRPLLHHFVLRAAILDTSKLKWVGREKLGDQDVFHISIDTFQVYINSDNYLVMRMQRPLYEPVYRKGLQTIDLAEYIKDGPLVIPQQYRSTKTNAVYGELTNQGFVTQIKTSFEFDPADFSIPDGYTANTNPDTTDCQISKIADGLFLLKSIDGPGGAYHNFVAEYADFLLVAEAPLDNNISRKAIRKIKATFPEKPIRYLVQTHHHNDHIGGVTAYLGEGATVVTTKDAAALVTKMAGAYGLANPGIEGVADMTVIKDKSNECVIYDIGPHPHSKEMLVLYFPRQKLLHQADMEAEDENFYSSVKSRNLDVRILSGVHDNVKQGKEIEKRFRR